MGPDTWLKRHAPVEGSWWPEWFAWLHAQSSGQADPPGTGAAGAGYGIASLYIGALGMLAAFLLGRRLFPQPRRAAWTALLYVASPVFMRYAHWATGRGLLVALMPLLVLAVPILAGASLAQVGEFAFVMLHARSEERRVGKERRSRWSPYH